MLEIATTRAEIATTRAEIGRSWVAISKEIDVAEAQDLNRQNP